MLLELRKHLDEPTRKTLVLLLNVPYADRKTLMQDEFELLTYLQKSNLVTEKDVKPLLQYLNSSPEDISLSSLRNFLQTYQEALASDIPQLANHSSRSNVPREIVFDKLRDNGKQEDEALRMSKFLSDVGELMNHLRESFFGTTKVSICKLCNL
jgi:hypothetical protein